MMKNTAGVMRAPPTRATIRRVHHTPTASMRRRLMKDQATYCERLVARWNGFPKDENVHLLSLKQQRQSKHDTATV